MKFSRLSIWKVFTLFVLICPVFVDLLNGYIKEYLGLDFSIGILYRSFLFIIAFPFLFLIKDKLLQVYIFLICMLWILFNIYWWYHGSRFSYYSFTWELQQFVRILLPFSLLSVFIYQLERDLLDLRYLMHCLVIAGTLSAFFILLSLFSGWGLKTYGDNSYAGYGVKSFFSSQNDISLMILLSLPLCLYLLIREKKFYILIFSLIILASLIVLSTRTGLLGGVGVFIAFFLSFMFYGRKEVSAGVLLKGIVFIIFITCFACFLNFMITFLSDEQNRFLLMKLYQLLEEGPRGTLAEEAGRHLHMRPFLNNLFGEGYYSMMKFMEMRSIRDAASGYGMYVEQDLLEMPGAYGYVLGGLLLFFPFALWLRACWIFTIERKLLDFTFLICISLFIIQSFTAGHALNSPTVATVIVIIYLYVIRRNRFISLLDR